MSRISLLICALPLAACGDGGGSTDIKGTLRFADRSDTEIARLVNAASGSEGFQAQSTAESYADPFEPTDPCPARSFSGNTGTITGGCTTQDGVAIEGSITIENPMNWCLVFDSSSSFCDMEYEGDFTAPSIYTFNGVTITQSGYVQAFDGVMTSATIDGWIDMDITSVQLDVAVRSDVYMARASNGRSISVSGSGVELIGVGGALVSGTINVSSTNEVSGGYTLRGADTLKVTVADRCVSWRIEGTDRMYTPCP